MKFPNFLMKKKIIQKDNIISLKEKLEIETKKYEMQKEKYELLKEIAAEQVAHLQIELKEDKKYSFKENKIIKELIDLKNEKMPAFFATRGNQDSLLFASITSLITKLAYFFLMDVQFRGIILIFIFFLFYFVNYIGDFYHLYMRERFYEFLISCMGKRALFCVERFKDHYYQKIPEEKYTFKEPKEHLGHIIFRNFLFFLVYLRLWFYAEPYIFLATRIILIYFLLFNQFLLTAYFLSFLLISSRMVYHVTDFTSKAAKEAKKKLLDEYYCATTDIDDIDKLQYEIVINQQVSPNYFNAVLFTFLALRESKFRDYTLFFFEVKNIYPDVEIFELYIILYNLNYTKNEFVDNLILDMQFHPYTNYYGKRLVLPTLITCLLLLDYLCFTEIISNELSILLDF